MSVFKTIVVVLFVCCLSEWVYGEPLGVNAVSQSPYLLQNPYPWRSFNPEDILVVNDGVTDAEIRLALVSRAERSIDVVTYAQTVDQEVGLPFYTALRDAANRGVHIRFLTNTMMSVLLDMSRMTQGYLAAKPSVAPIEILFWGRSGTSGPWQIGDFIHEKFVIVDKKWVFHTGRMISKNSVNWLDKAYLLKGDIAHDTVMCFDRLWNEAKRTAPVLVSPRPSKQSPVSRYRRFIPPASMDLRIEGQKRDFARFTEWIDRTELTADQHSTIRMLHHDFVRQMRVLRYPADVATRLHHFEDPVLEALIERILEPQTREVLIGTMVAIFQPKFRDALKIALSRGTRVHLFIDSVQAAATQTPAALNFAIALPEMDELLAAGAKIDVFNKNEEDGVRQIYLHEKLAIVDDTVFFGSHNFTQMSTVNNDETAYEVRSPEFAKKMRHIFFTDMTLGGTPYSREEVARELKVGGPFAGLRQWLGWKLVWLF